MVDPIIIRNSGDAYISSAYPKKNFSNTRKLYVKSNNPDSRYAYLYFGQPFPAGATILSAKLVLRNGTVLNGPTTTVTVQRIKEKWSKNKITWNNRPDVEGASVTVTKNGNVPVLTEWEFNITAMMQSVANGSKWYGVRFTANDGKGDWFHGSLAGSIGRRPYIEIEYIEASTEPENLSPTSGGVVSSNKPTLSFDYFDRRGQSVVSAVQAQTASSSTGFGAPTWDSGEVATTVAELDLAGTSYPGAAIGSTVWWRARARNSAGQLSGWSTPASFVYRAKTPIIITNPINPGGGATPYVEDSSPPIEWTFAGTQVHKQIIVRDPANGSIVYDSGKMTSNVKDFTIPDKKLLYGKIYELEVRVWDNYTRIQNGGVSTFSSQKSMFEIVGTTAVTPTTGLTAVQQKPFHWIRLNWVRAAGAPDFYDIVMNGKVIERVEGVDVHSGQNGTYLSLHGRPRRDDVWAVIPVVNGQSAKNFQTVTTNVRVISCILSEMDGSDPIVLLNYENSGSRSSIQAIHETLGNRPPVLITQAIRGKEGTITGVLSGAAIPGVDSFEEKDRFERLREREGRSLMLTIIEDSMEVFIAKSDISPVADGDGITYNVYFDYYQKDF